MYFFPEEKLKMVKKPGAMRDPKHSLCIPLASPSTGILHREQPGILPAAVLPPECFFLAPFALQWGIYLNHPQGFAALLLLL